MGEASQDIFAILNPVSQASLVATLLMAIVAYYFSFHMTKVRRASDRWVIFWLVWDAMIHFMVEGPFVIISATGTVEKSDHWLSLLWKEYAKADKRWGVSDPGIVSLEALTVFFDGPLCIILIYAILKNKPYKHFIQIVLCVCELYGGWMTFAPDWFIGSPNLDTGNWVFLWLYLVFFNGIWVVVPLALLWQSWNEICHAFATTPRSTAKKHR